MAHAQASIIFEGTSTNGSSNPILPGGVSLLGPNFVPTPPVTRTDTSLTVPATVGQFQILPNSNLAITGGASFAVVPSATPGVGQGNFQGPNMAIVSGTGSSLSTSGNLVVGSAGQANATLTIKNGGKASAIGGDSILAM